MIRDKIWDVFPKKKLDKQLTRRIRKHKKILLMKHIYFSDSLYIRISAKNVSWPWLSPLWGWGSLTMAFTGVVWLWHLLAFTMAFTNLKIKNHNYQVHMTWCTWYLNQQEFVHRGYSVFNRICQYLKVRHCPWAGNSCLKRHIFSE